MIAYTLSHKLFDNGAIKVWSSSSMSFHLISWGNQSNIQELLLSKVKELRERQREREREKTNWEMSESICC